MTATSCIGYFLPNLLVSLTLPNTGSLAASARRSMKSTRSLRFGNPLLSLIRRASSLHFSCSAMGNFPDIFAKFVMFISGRAFIDLKVSYNVLDRSANFRNPGPSLLDMFGPSTKASTHPFATMCGCPNVAAAFLGPSTDHQVLLQIPLQHFWLDHQETAIDETFSEFLKCSECQPFHQNVL